MPEVVGSESLLSKEGFFARLFGRSSSGARQDPLYGPDLPVVLLTGGPGMGKERLLHEVRDRFAKKVPVIYVDCRQPTYAAHARQEPGARSAATEVLFDAAERLSAWHGTGGSFTFPRLFAGLAVLAPGVQQAGAAAVAAEVERYEELAQRRGRFGMGRGGFWSGVIRGTLKGLLATAAANALGPYPAVFVNALVDGILAQSAPGGRKELQRVYGAYPGAGGVPAFGLKNLARDFHAGGEARKPAEAFLFRALREDLEAEYATMAGWLSLVGRPALLLDHADSPLGQALLRAVLADRRDGQRDRVVVVGTARRADGGAFLHRGLPLEETRAPAAFRPADDIPLTWTRPTDRAAEGVSRAKLADGVLLLQMPYLTSTQISHEISRWQTGTPPAGGAHALLIDSAVTSLSVGRPHTVLRLAAAASSFEMPEDANHRDLLNAPLRDDTAPARPVAEVLLQELIEDQLPTELPPEFHPQWLDLLTHLSIAHDTECADVLLRHHQEGHTHKLAAHQVSKLLVDAGWPRCERHFIGDFGLRQLLLHRLYGLRPDGAAWNAGHQLLRDHYAAPPAQDETPPPGRAFGSVTAHWMNHHLVSSGAEDVVRELVVTLPGRPQEWCAELLEATQAPYPPGADARLQRALGQVQIPGTELQQIIDRLLHTVWLCQERTRPIAMTLDNTLTTLLTVLGTKTFNGAGHIGAATANWAGLAAAGQPLLHCSCMK
ncbi:hypothetical protein [Streptomyces boninensis]|uniref:hypothetical protein n=1 Tax=Streptomyces boninensis TaxID=2039455 RepID=UPI003B21DD7F